MRKLLPTTATLLAALTAPLHAASKQEPVRVVHQVRQVEGWNVRAFNHFQLHQEHLASYELVSRIYAYKEYPGVANPKGWPNTP